MMGREAMITVRIGCGVFRLRARFRAIGIVAVLGVLCLPATTGAQYMYLDSNGNGIHDVGDRVHSCSVPGDSVSIWLDTARNRDGSPGTCPFETGALNMSHYEFVLQAVGGTVVWGHMTNHITGFTTRLAYASRDTTDPIYYHNGWASLSVSGIPAPGRYKLASLTVGVAAGSPRIDIITRHPERGRERTSFGCECPVDDEYDHTNKRSQGWNDVDGLEPPLSTDAPPVVVAPGIVVPQNGSLVAFNVTASDPNTDPILSLTADLSGLPPGNDASFIVSGQLTPQASGILSWTPTQADSGNYSIGFLTSNCANSPVHTTVVHVIGNPTGIEDDQQTLTNSLSMSRPNPFQLSTSLEYTLSHESPVHISVFSASGRRVRSLFQGRLPAGPHRVIWDGMDEKGNLVPSGVYWCRLEAGSFHMSRRMALIR